MLDIESLYTKLQNLKLLLERKISILTLQVLLIVAYLFRIIKKLNLSINIFSSIENNSLFILNTTILLILADIILSVLWIFFRRTPKFKHDEIGVVFAIRTDNEQIREKIKKDFINTVYKIIKSVDVKITLAILSEYHSEKINNNPKLLPKYHLKTRSYFIMHGIARIRKHKSKDHYCIELDQSVTHRPLPGEIRNNIIRDMFTVFPRSTLVPMDDEYNGFRFNTELFSYGAIYILGLSCLYSGKPDIAYKLHSRILNIKIETNIAVIQRGFNRIQNSTKNLVFKELDHFARREYYELKNITEMGKYINLAKKLKIIDYNFLLLEAIYLFLIKNIEGALIVLSQAKKISNGDYTWAYSKAFIQAYKGNLGSAYSLYRLGFNHQAVQNVHIQCEEFILKILKEEPDKYQLHYCLGLIYFYIHEDNNLAELEFNIFIEKDNIEKKHADIREDVELYLTKIGNDKRAT